MQIYGITAKGDMQSKIKELAKAKEPQLSDKEKLKLKKELAIKKREEEIKAATKKQFISNMEANAKSKKMEQIYSQNKSSSDNKSPKKETLLSIASKEENTKENFKGTIKEEPFPKEDTYKENSNIIKAWPTENDSPTLLGTGDSLSYSKVIKFIRQLKISLP